MMKISVFASSSSKVASGFFETAEELGTLIAKKGHSVVFGGGDNGLMGALAKGALNNKGQITGVIPEFMVKNGWGNSLIDTTIITADMNSRKKKIFEISDAVIALPGGIGTLEELTEAITLKQLGLFNGPVVILNTDGFYDTLIAYLHQLVSGNFMREEHTSIWKVVSNPEEALDYILTYDEWDTDYVRIARI